MAGEPNMNLDGAKTSSGWMSRFWRTMKQGFGALPRMYWWYAAGCVLVFSVAWPTWSPGTLGLETLRFGIPDPWTRCYGVATDGNQVANISHVVDRFELHPLQLLLNACFWCVALIITLIPCLIAGWRMPSWPHSGPVAWRFLVIVISIAMVSWSLHQVPMHLIYYVAPSSLNDLWLWEAVASIVQRAGLGILILAMDVGITRRLWLASPHVARWVGGSLLVVGVCVLEPFLYGMWGIGEQVIVWVAAVVAVAILMDMTIVWTIWIVRRRQCRGLAWKGIERH